MASPSGPSSPIGLHRVLEPAGALPQAATRLDTRLDIWPDETRIAVERLNLDAASYRQLRESNSNDPDAIRKAVLSIVEQRGKMQNPVTGSGGMLVGTVDAVGPDSPLGFEVGDRIATLVSLTLTPLAITDGLRDWDGQSEQVPCSAHAILFGRSVAARIPDDLAMPIALSVFDVCGAPALTHRRVERAIDASPSDDIVVCVIGAAGKSGSLSCAAARDAGASRIIGIVPNEGEAGRLRASELCDEVCVVDARDAVAVSAAVAATGGPVHVTVVCVDVPGCEHGAILATRDGGTVVFFSMATSFSGAALGAEGLGADVEMLVGNGYTPGHADYALDVYRRSAGVRSLFEAREGLAQ
jgi:L-erythro-3,5-diaminohexanoate dehydrogenase